MSIQFALKEEHCINLNWKIKNFSFGSETISSPEFILDGELFRLDIQPKTVECRLVVFRQDWKYQWTKYAMSFLPCDGSEPLVSDSQCLQVSKEVLFKNRRSAFLPEDTLTVRFQHPVFSKRGNLLVRSKIGMKRKCFLWTLKKFNQDKYNAKDLKITAEYSNRYGILELCLKTMDGINSDENIYIEISRTNGEKCYCVLKVSVLDNEGKAVNCVSDEFLFQNQDSLKKWIFPPIIKKSKLFACKDILLPNDTLSLKCEIAISSGAITDQTAVLSYFEDVTPLLQESELLSKCFKEQSKVKSRSDSVTDLQSDLKKILDSPTGLSDVSLQVSSKTIHAHKAILGARSLVFEALLTDNTKENFVIEDLEVDTVRKLLFYIYTDTINDYQESSIRKLYLAAVKYQVLSLKQKCSSFLRTNLSVSNVCEMLVLANSYKDSDLEKAVLDFISTHHSEVFASKEWKSLEQTNSSLACHALRNICSNKSFH